MLWSSGMAPGQSFSTWNEGMVKAPKGVGPKHRQGLLRHSCGPRDGENL